MQLPLHVHVDNSSVLLGSGALHTGPHPLSLGDTFCRASETVGTLSSGEYRIHDAWIKISLLWNNIQAIGLLPLLFYLCMPTYFPPSCSHFRIHSTLSGLSFQRSL